MVTTAANTPLPQALVQADQALRAGDPAAAERVLTPLLLGGDPRLLRPAGISEARLRVVILLVMSLFTALAMIVMLGRLGAAAPTAGFGLELDAIVAVIIGGASFRGGSGRLRDTLVGVAFLAILNNGLQGLQMSDAQFMLIKGIAILAALTLRALLFRFFSSRRVAA